MKTKIHPTWNNQVKVTCNCGNTFTTGSVVDSIQVEVCSACHPFYTGQMKFIDLQGRVDKFVQQRKAAANYVKKSKKQDDKKDDRVLSLRELLQKEQKATSKETKSPSK